MQPTDCSLKHDKHPGDPQENITDAENTQNSGLWREFIQSIIDNIRDVIKIVDKDRRIVYANKSAEREAGKPIDQIVGGFCYQHFRGSELPCENCPTQHTIETGESSRIFQKLTDAKGNERFLEIYCFPIKGESDKVEMAMEISHDVTKQKKLEEELRKAEKLAYLGELSAGMAHELRNPLGSITTAAKLLSSDSPPLSDEDRRVILGALKKEVDRLNQILTDFLKFARPRKPNLVLGNINRVLNRILTILESNIDLVGSINVKRELEGTIPEFYFDAEQIEQVLWNIVLNAVQAMEGQGELVIATSISEDVVSISISDTGEGIPEGQIEKIFEPFYTKKKGGSGLGLSIAQRIIEEHKGSIKVQSQIGKGTTFTIFLSYRH